MELRDLPISALKIPREFISPLKDDMLREEEKDAARQEIKLITFEAGLKNLAVVAEGIENDCQLDFLSSLRIHYFQGFHPKLGKPITEEVISEKYRLEFPREQIQPLPDHCTDRELIKL